MTRVLFDRRAGFCAGVKKAIRGARDEAGKRSNVVSYGELIHNPRVIKSLAEEGIRVKYNLEEIAGHEIVIVRAHGIPPHEEEWLKKNQREYLDLTCRRVKEIHRTIIRHREAGYFIVIVGNPDHPEVRGHLGYAGESARVIDSVKNAHEFSASFKNPKTRLLVLAQTTISPELYDRVVAVLKEQQLQISSINTLCPFVLKRQDWLRRFSLLADASIIIGGRNSSNTGKLFDIAAKNGPVFWLTGAQELEAELILQYPLVALTAGASTPVEELTEVADILAAHGALIEPA
ncbi:MAG TPA: 4-hydroxy-3-methylbut-2-enyl diphosphate reductase [Spirochaetales bacterium]|nr:4-hydroxy-3-methylbut-2-enyl diphosphate reductase [Spirochaetales bacterium]